MTRIAAVVIGRNEGPRLPRALRSVVTQCDPVVYVDSASTDGSAERARAQGAAVVALDLSIPFTFGRARNAGTVRVLELAPDTDYIQFLDADSEIVAPWLTQASTTLAAAPRLGAVHGRVRERSPGDSLYDRLYALELDPRTEEQDVFGGMAMLRVAALQQVGRYAETLRSFEDHDLSFRLRHAGWQIRLLDTDMVIHEAGMTRWQEWWAREWRAGYARAQLLTTHGWAGGGEWRGACASICFWSALVPALVVISVWQWGSLAVLVLLAYPALLYRIFRRMRRRGFVAADAALYAAGRVIGKFPQLQGVLSFLYGRSQA